MGNVFQFAWEVELIKGLQELIRTFPFLKYFFSFFTMLGEPVTLVLIVIFFYWCFDKKLGIRIAISILMANVTNGMIKNVFERIRPHTANNEIECIRPAESRYDINDMAKQGFSFPSGHATCTANLLTTLYREKKNNKLLAFGSLIVFLVCLSRVALGVHYPTDVLVGVIFGIIPAVVVDRLYQKMEKKKFYLMLLIYSCLGFFYCRSNDYYSVVGLTIGFLSGDLFDEKYVRFENTTNVLRMIFRILGGAAIFLFLVNVLKLPFSKETLEAENMFSYLYRVFRYGTGTFVIIGLYPAVFKYNILRLKEKDAD
ncbi:MAG: phosphatase PAP2 family protein [Erysipelotrichaceae bacterium]|nr:phosphatase PAP2 family protein [Erysipelotrichaceae bacterium]